MKDARYDRLVQLLQQWAGVVTWHTLHPLDEARFYSAVEKVHKEFGADITEGEFKKALAHVVKNTPLGLDLKPVSSVSEFSKRAFVIMGYMNFKSKK